MKIDENIGRIDLMIRIVVLFVAIYLGHRISSWFFLFALFEFFLIVLRWCPFYDLFKINTLGGKK